MTTPHPDREDLMAWLDGEIPAERARDVQRHVETCDSCAALAGQLRAPAAALAGWPVETPPASLTSRVGDIARPSGRPAVPASRWRSARWRLAALAALVLIGIAVPLRMQCVEASPVCRLDRVQQFLGVAAPSSVSVSRSAGAGTASGQDVRDGSALHGPVAPAPPLHAPKAVVMMFVDWQCPACRAAHESYAAMFDEFERSSPGAVQFIVKDFPINAECNPGVSANVHVAACEAAVAVRLAREKGRDREMIQWLFANQEALTPEAVKAEVALRLGITDFDARAVDEIEHVRADASEGVGLHVQFTPSCYLNGVLTNQAATGRSLPVEDLRRMIEAELARVR